MLNSLFEALSAKLPAWYIPACSLMVGGGLAIACVPLVQSLVNINTCQQAMVGARDRDSLDAAYKVCATHGIGKLAN